MQKPCYFRSKGLASTERAHACATDMICAVDLLTATSLLLQRRRVRGPGESQAKSLKTDVEAQPDAAQPESTDLVPPSATGILSHGPAGLSLLETLPVAKLRALLELLKGLFPSKQDAEAEAWDQLIAQTQG